MQIKTTNPIGKTLDEPCAYLQALDGLPLRYGLWRTSCAPFRGTILLLTGRSEFMEKYAETIERLNQKGFDLFSLDWRGQGLSGRMLSDPCRGYVRSYEQYMADLELMLCRIVTQQKRGPLYILAHSMGGHITLRYLVSNPRISIAKAALVSPMLDIVTTPAPAWFVRGLSRMMIKTGHHARTIFGAGRFNPYKNSFERNRLTSDPQRFQRVRRMVARNPNLAVGGVTYGWLAATFDSIDYLKRSADLARFTNPLMILLAGDDHVVSNRAALLLAQKMVDCRLEVIPGARHEILQEQDHLQAYFWRAFDRFFNVST